jgi:hypothetical protein
MRADPPCNLHPFALPCKRARAKGDSLWRWMSFNNLLHLAGNLFVVRHVSEDDASEGQEIIASSARSNEKRQALRAIGTFQGRDVYY